MNYTCFIQDSLVLYYYIMKTKVERENLAVCMNQIKKTRMSFVCYAVTVVFVKVWQTQHD